MLKAFLERTEGLKVLVDVLRADAQDEAPSAASDEDQVRSAVYELLLLIAYNQEDLGLDGHDLCQIAALPVLSLVRSEREACY